MKPKPEDFENMPTEQLRARIDEVNKEIEQHTRFIQALVESKTLYQEVLKNRSKDNIIKTKGGKNG